jgi:hypothetical protein
MGAHKHIEEPHNILGFELGHDENFGIEGRLEISVLCD